LSTAQSTVYGAAVNSLPRILRLLLFIPGLAIAGNNVVNLSHYDEMSPDFGQMARSGIVGVIHEATFPKYNLDARFAERASAVSRAGLLWGAYHFADATDPARQADHFLATVQSRSGGSPTLLVLDFEKNDHYPGGTMNVHQAAAFVDRVRQRTGKYPGLYASENRIKEVINHSAVSADAKRILANCWLWVANYHYTPKATAPWSSWTMWQYTGDGICDLPRSSFPISIANVRKAERNIFSGSVGSLKAFWNNNAWATR
jgi:lysozyme